MKKLIAILLSLTLALSLTVTALAAEAEDAMLVESSATSDTTDGRIETPYGYDIPIEIINDDGTVTEAILSYNEAPHIGPCTACQQHFKEYWEMVAKEDATEEVPVEAEIVDTEEPVAVEASSDAEPIETATDAVLSDTPVEESQSSETEDYTPVSETLPASAGETSDVSVLMIEEADEDSQIVHTTSTRTTRNTERSESVSNISVAKSSDEGRSTAKGIEAQNAMTAEQATPTALFGYMTLILSWLGALH